MTIKEMRVAAGLSQDKLAAICNVTQGAVAQWEGGETYPHATKLPVLSRALKSSEKDIIEAITRLREKKKGS